MLLLHDLKDPPYLLSLALDSNHWNLNEGEWQCVDKPPAEDDAGKTRAGKAMPEKKKHFVYQADTSTTST